MARAQGVAYGGAVVVERHAVHGDLLAVDLEPLLGRHLDLAESRDDGHFVLLLGTYAYRDGIQIRLVAAPQQRLLDSEGYVDRPVGLDPPLEVARVHGVALRAAHRDGQIARLVDRGGDPHRSRGLDQTVGDVVLVDQHAVRTVIERRHGGLLGHDQLHVAVDTSVEVYLRRGGQNVVLVGVVHRHQHRVVGAELHELRDLEGEGRPSPAVLARVVAVDEHVGDALHAVKLQEQTLARPLGGHVNVTQIVGRGLQIGAATRQRIEIPRMR